MTSTFSSIIRQYAKFEKFPDNETEDVKLNIVYENPSNKSAKEVTKYITGYNLIVTTSNPMNSNVVEEISCLSPQIRFIS